MMRVFGKQRWKSARYQNLDSRRHPLPPLLEPLEQRILLSGSPMIDDVPEIMGPVASVMAASPTDYPVVNVGSGVEIDVLKFNADNVISGSATKTVVPSKYRYKVTPTIWSKTQEAASKGKNAEPFEVMIQAADSPDAMVSDLEKLGYEVGYVGKWSHKTVMTIRADQLSSILDLDSVASVGSVVAGFTNTGSVVTEGDSVLRANDARFDFPDVDGTGVKIGVISDGIGELGDSITSGDLPGYLAEAAGANVYVYAEGAGGDSEGTAMMEIIHDMAPGATLYFSSGIANSSAMEASINWMIDQGVDIIVDDIGFFDQPFFSDGDLAAAAMGATTAGISYISAAGNAALNHYQEDFEQTSQITGTRIFHDFDPGVTDQGFFVVQLEPGAVVRVDMQWSEAFNTTPSDYGLSIWGDVGGGFGELDYSSAPNASNPYEVLEYQNPTLSTIQFGITAFKADSMEPDRELEFFVRYAGGTTGTGTVSSSLFTAEDSIFGHQMSEAVIAVAAVDQATGLLENFSSRGTSTIYTNFTTQTSIDREVLDLTAVDHVATSVPGFTNFGGTSAAAPHVAAVAALVLDAAPALTVAQLTDRLQKSAIDLGAEGYDNKFGHGRVDAVHAVNDTDTAIGTLMFGDFTGDNKADLIWTKTSNGIQTVAYWEMDGATRLSAANIDTSGGNWEVEGIGDLDLDGDADLVFRNTVSNEVNWWEMDGTTRVGGTNILTLPNINWQVEGLADMNEDGHLDIVARNTNLGVVRVWLLYKSIDPLTQITDPQESSGFPLQDSSVNLIIPSGDSIAGIRDADGDGHVDLFIRTSTGANHAIRLDGLGNRLAGDVDILDAPNANWKLGRVDDFNGDGVVDLFWRYHGNEVNSQGLNALWNLERSGTDLVRTSYVFSLRVELLDWEIKDGQDV